jgi:hypothetical protein
MSSIRPRHAMQTELYEYARHVMSRQEKVFLVAFMAYSAAFLAITIITGSKNDCISYTSQWQATLQGRDPWFETDNAYGPVPLSTEGRPPYRIIIPLVLTVVTVSTLASFFPVLHHNYGQWKVIRQNAGALMFSSELWFALALILHSRSGHRSDSGNENKKT